MFYEIYHYNVFYSNLTLIINNNSTPVITSVWFHPQDTLTTAGRIFIFCSLHLLLLSPTPSWPLLFHPQVNNSPDTANKL